jgi:superfamily II DNA or RNA helicase
MFGRIVYTEDIIKLQESGFISKLNITLLKIIDNVVENDRNMLFHTNSLRKYRPDETGYSEIEFDEAVKAEDEYFVKHYKDLYKPVFEYLFNLNTNTLILFDRIEIGKNLFEYAKELYLNKKDVFYIDGSINVKDREFARESFEKSDGNLLIAQSSVMSTGVNIKRLTNLVFLTSSKSFSRVIQSIGRTLRLHESKDAAHLIDVSFNFKYSQRHLNERLKLYKEMYNKKPDKIYMFEI